MTQTIRARLALPLVLGLALQVAAPAQEAGEQRSSQFPRVDELVVTTFTPQKLHRNELYAAAQRLFGDEITVETEGGGLASFDRFILLGGSIVVRDTPERTRAIVETLRGLEEEIGASETGRQEPPQFVSATYTPRYVGAGALLHSLGGLHRKLVPPGGGGSFENVSLFGQSALHLRDTRERVDEIVAYLRSVDVPAAQVTVTVLVIAGNDSGTSSPALPAELVQNLARLLPATGFELLSTGLLRGSVDHSMQLRAELGDGRNYSIELEPEAYDPDQAELSLRRCSFQFFGKSVQAFETATSLRHGEYTVLGAVGSGPVFVVLRLQVAGR